MCLSDGPPLLGIDGPRRGLKCAGGQGPAGGQRHPTLLPARWQWGIGDDAQLRLSAQSWRSVLPRKIHTSIGEVVSLKPFQTLRKGDDSLRSIHLFRKTRGLEGRDLRVSAEKRAGRGHSSIVPGHTPGASAADRGVSGLQSGQFVARWGKSTVFRGCLPPARKLCEPVRSGGRPSVPA